MRKFLLLFGLFFCTLFYQVNAKKVKALFIGNSYTASNNLPEIIKQLALSTGDTLVYNQNIPGGQTLQGHSTNAITLGLIEDGNWDYVILQEQSQLPSFPDIQVTTQVYPYAKMLDSLIKVHNPCATTLFYMTWGRKNGDVSNCDFFPVVCTYEGMDSMLQLRYTYMAEMNEAAIAPVAKVWRQLRTAHPAIELYVPDESHPSNNGSFAAACSFYSIFFEKDPSLSSYNYTLTTANASIIKEVAKNIVYDSLSIWNRFVPARVSADFDFSIVDNEVNFTNLSLNADTYTWDFGDGHSSIEAAPNHIYEAEGIYIVKLTAGETTCESTDLFIDTIRITSTTGIPFMESEWKIDIYPNPASINLYIRSAKPMESFKVYDLNGRELISQFAKHSHEAILNIAHLSKGIYFLQIISPSNSLHYAKFVKQ